MRGLHLFFTWTLIMVAPLSVFGQADTIQFDHITSDHGLSQGTGNCILKDRKGFMWFGTALGLNRYDGHSIKVFRNLQDDSTSISHNYITALFEDRDGVLWVGTSNGINKYNPALETFERIKVNVESPSLKILSISQDQAGNVYFGTEGKGIVRLDKIRQRGDVLVESAPAPDELKHANIIPGFFIHGDQFYAISLFDIKKITASGNIERIPWGKGSEPSEFMATFSDKRGKFWAATGSGLATLNILNEIHVDYPIKELKGVPILAIAEDQYENLWVTTLGSGLAIVDKSRRRVTFRRKNMSDRRSINNNALSSIYIDPSGIVWIGGFGGGINKYDPAINRFQVYRDEYSDNLTSVMEDRTGLIWFVNGSTGVTSYDPKTRERKNYGQITTWQYALCEDDYGNIWSTHPQVGLSKFSKHKGQFELVVKAPSGYAVIKGPDGKLYVAVRGQSLASIDPLTYEFVPIDSGKNIGPLAVLVSGRNNNIWTGGGDGRLYELDVQSQRYTLYTFAMEGKTLTGRIVAMCEDQRGNIWLAYAGFGVVQIDRKSMIILARYDMSNGLPNNDIANLTEDNQGNIWAGTHNGLAVIRPTSRTIETFTTRDGVVSNEFNSFVAHKNKDGRLYLGGMEGFNYFFPEDLIKNEHRPPVVLTGFRISNRLVPIGEGKDSAEFFLPKAIAETDEIKLNHDQNFISFDFAALNYSVPEKNRYAYMLEGFDRTWIYCGHSKTATYTNLGPGRYTFRVKACNSSGVWNDEGTSVILTIQPPFWKTWWAYSIYFLLIVGVMYLFWRYFAHRQYLQSELKLKSLESQKLKEVDEMKTRFYTNVSHEFRTPLTLILGPLESAMLLSNQAGHDEITKHLSVVSRNAERLLELLRQLMDFSKLEAGTMKLQLEQSDLVLFARNCTEAFSPIAVSKGIRLHYTTTCRQLTAFFDRDKIEKIINNLLSNAMKFTREGGTVGLTLDHGGDEVVIKVIDDGIGIPADKVNLIFDRFFQVDNTVRTFEGAGIGLALLKELVVLHNGRIEVSSAEGEGTTFTLSFPMEVTESVRIEESKKTAVIASTSAIETGPTALPATTGDAYEDADEKPVILIVEDNTDVRRYIRGAFGSEFEVVEAEDGQKALSIAEQRIPDLVITDIMMPRMDGEHLCRVLKSNEKTSHIPVILLTARASQEERLQGLETGADDYITKPFFLKELLVRVKNLIEQRKILRKRFTHTMLLQPKEVAVTSADEMFLKKCIKAVEDNMPNPDFSVDAFGREVGMSRSQLHRKLTALTGQSASEFVRNLRLKRAEELIRKNYGNTAEVAYRVGFNSVSYFIKCFKEVYGKTPTEIDKVA